MKFAECIQKFQKVAVQHYTNQVNEKPLVSICVQTYQHKEFIKKCLDGILMQKTKFAFEILLGDDASTDGTREICLEYAQLYPDKIRLFLHNRENNIRINGYPTGRFNLLYNLYSAQGKYIALCEGDDYWTDPLKLQKQVDFLEGSPDSILCFHRCVFRIESENGIVHHEQNREAIEYDYNIGNLLINWGIPTASMVYRNIIKELPEWFLTIASADMGIAMLLFDKGTFNLIEGVMSIYRIHSGGVAQNHRGYRMIHYRSYFYSQLNEFFNYKYERDIYQALFQIMQIHGGQDIFIPSSITSKSSININKAQIDSYKKVDWTNIKVSVCIPTYNGEKYIAEALNSVFKQTYPNIEIILSDDNSTDRTVEIAKSFEQKSSFDFSVLEHSQYGLAQNWNFCISKAKGKYIKFLFQDDLLEPNAIEEMVNLAEQDEEIGLVFSPRSLFTNSGDANYDSNFLRHHEAKDVHEAWSRLQSIQSGQELLQDINILENPINKVGEPSTVLIRKEVFERVGLFNPEFCQLVDLDMWLRIMSQYKVGFVNKTLSHFRIHPQQQTRRNAASKEAIFSDYQKLFHTIYTDSRYPQLTRQQAFCRYAILNSRDADLRQARIQLAKQWLSISDNQLEDMYQGMLDKTHKVLLNSGIKYTNLTEDEQIFVNDIVLYLSQGFEQPKAIQYLLAAMLYCRPDRLPLQHDLSYIPDWFLKDYLQFLFSSPIYFKELGEADNYYKHMQEWLDYLHASIFDNLDSSSWQEVAKHFAQIANFIPVYFNEANLKDIYTKRAKIIELFLKNNGYQVDYEFPDRPVNRKKIRLGILAAHFTPGSETFAYLPVYEYLSRDFEVILYTLKQTGHPLEEHCRSCANSFKLLPQNLSEQVKTIRTDDLDILFIATNVTAVTNQICLLASHRLARIQVTSGGSVVTTGMRHMDYYISGTLTDPSPTAQEHYREKLVKLEGTAHCFSYGCESETVTSEVNRKNLSISEEAVVFISGANFFKIVPELIHTWAKIIAEVPNSVLVLLPFGPNWSNTYPKQAFENNLNQVFSQYGISAERLLILDPQPVPNREDVKEYFKIADIYLDSYPFSGTTSLIEPLQVNLPVISRQGHTFRSAMGAAMVRSLDLPDLVADSEETYIQLAVKLGTNPELRKQKSDRIFQKMQQNPSFLDSRSYSAQMGALFQQLFQQDRVNNLIDRLGLRDINLVMFPDWHQSEESLYEDFANVLKTMSSNPDKSRMTLLIDTDGIDGEDANLLVSGVAMNLLMEEAVDIADELEVALLDDLTENEWELLLSLLQGRISLGNENQNAIAKAKAQSLKIHS